MPKLRHYHHISEKRKDEWVNQSLLINVDFDPEENSIENIEVFLMQNGNVLAEISKLLDKAEGDPLCAILEAISWSEIYADANYEKEVEHA